LRLASAEVGLFGNTTLRDRREPTLPSVTERVERVMGATWTSTAATTATHARNYEIAAAALTELLVDLRQLIEVDLASLRDDIDQAGGPWTSGSGLPTWPPG
jgi:hypothetical protein